MSTKAPILQHYYTRAQSGFDTVAMSKSLDKRLIQAHLQPLCYYKAPLELQQKGIDDQELYPESLTVFPVPTGETIISRSVYVSADFTGQRSAAFTHQYIVPASRKEEFIKEPEKLFRVRHFVREYDISLNKDKELRELEEVDYDRSVLDLAALLSRLHISDAQFTQLLYAVMTSFSTKPGLKKKVYVALAADVTASSKEAKLLAEWIVRLLPYSLRRQFGVNTFHPEPEGKTGIQLMFVEKGSIAQADRLGEKDALFDFHDGTFRNADLPGTDHIYLEFVWKNRMNLEALEDFFTFCDMALQGLGTDMKESVGTYYQLCALYQICRGELGYYENNRAGIINGILLFLTKETAGEKPELVGLFSNLLKKDLQDISFMPATDYIDGILKGCEMDPTIWQYFAALLVDRMARRSHDPASVYWIPDYLIGKGDIYGKLIAKLHQYPNGRSVAEAYLLAQVRQVQNVKSFQQAWTFWFQTVPWAAGELFFRQEMSVLPSRLLADKDSSVMVRDGEEFYRLLDIAEKSAASGEWNRLAAAIKANLVEGLLTSLEPRNLPYEIWEKLGFLFPPGGQRDKSDPIRLDPKFRLMEGVCQIITSREPSVLDMYTGWKDSEINNAHEILRSLYRNPARMGQDNFGRIAYGFCYPRSGRNQTELEYSFRELLHYIAGNSGMLKVSQYINWSIGYRPFCNDFGKMDLELYRAIDDLYTKEFPEAWKDKKVQEVFSHVKKGHPLYRLIKGLNRRNNAILRYYDQHTKFVKRFGLMAIGLAVVFAAGAWFINSGFLGGNTGGSDANNEVSTSPVATGTVSGHSTGTPAPESSPAQSNAAGATPVDSPKPSASTSNSATSK
jgi:hypothetical protein